MDDLTTEFVVEATESLGDLDIELVKLEKDPSDAAVLDGVFRIVHTIKGTCGFLDLPRLEALAHAAEGVLGRLRAGDVAADGATISPILEALDRIKAVLAGLETDGQEPAGDDADLIATLNAVGGGENRDDADLIDLGAPLPDDPELATLDDAAPKPSPRTAVRATPDGAAAVGAIRVGVSVLEDLIAMVSELVLTRNQLLQTQRQVEDPDFAAPLQRLDLITTELQEGVMKARMQPIGAAWSKLPRIVRDLERDLAKQIDLEMLGADTDLDRQVLEMIRDPLIHMIRNACDHGVESPREREAVGKPATGRITLHAYHEGGHIVIRIADDGRGLSPERIKAKAIANGLATAEDMKGLSTREVCQFIFEPGFSTAAAITNISGRGVGMDVVRTNIERFGGAIDLDSIEGVGSTFTIRIPLTLAIVAALIVECGGARFAIPQTGVLELARAGGRAPNRIERIGDTPVMRLRDRLLPLTDLAGLLELDDDPLADDRERHVVVCEVGRERFGVVVDRVFDTEEIVVKPLAPILRDNPVFSGNTVLGDGGVAMILDPAGIAAELSAGFADDLAVDDLSAGDAGADEKTAVLLFKAGDGPLKLAPLAAVTRLEDVPKTAIERVDGRDVVQFRGALMPLLDLGERQGDAARPVIVFSDGRRWAGLVVDEIVDIVEIDPDRAAGVAVPDRLGGVVIDGETVEAVDVDRHLAEIYPDWSAADAAPQRRNEILVVDDSPFFRHLLNPLLQQAGYDVTAVESAENALALKDAGRRFDLIVSDIDMPGMDGFAFAEAVRASREWRETPLLALCGDGDPADGEDRPGAAFAGYVGKTDRDGLLQSLADALAGGRSA